MEPPTQQSQSEGAAANGVETLYLESGEEDQSTAQIKSAHVVDKDSWRQVGVLLTTSFNCAYIFSFSNLIMVPLGWIWGTICLIAIAGFSFYSSWVLASFQFIDGRRFIRYRDIMGFLFGRKMYYLTYILQFVSIILGNMGFILLGGRALKEINRELSTSPQRVQVFILINGVVCFIYATIVPNLSAMRHWLGISASMATTYIITTFIIMVKDGNDQKVKDYSIPGSGIGRFFNALGAMATIVVSNNTGFLPEIQSTLRKPVVENMRRAITMQYTFGVIFYYGMTIAGYWAYGSSVSEYLPRELSGPKWGRILINSLTFIQNMISQHMFAAPVHEAMDTKFLNLEERLDSRQNMMRRVLLRAIVLGTNTLVVATFPFMGDFIILGCFALVQLTFVFPSIIFIRIKGKSITTWSRAWHWTLVLLFITLAVLTTAAAIRLIVHNTKTYHLFANT